VSFEFDGEWFDEGFRADLLVERCVLVEIKSVEKLDPIHFMQTRTYLRLIDCPVGLLINFNSVSFKNAVRRIPRPYTAAHASLIQT